MKSVKQVRQYREHFVALVLVMILAFAGFARAGATLQLNGKLLKTKAANSGAIAPLRDALFKLDADTDANGGKLPADAVDRLKKIQSMTSQAKSEIRALVVNLQANKETDVFNEGIIAEAKLLGSAKLSLELSAGGTPLALLQRADSLIDQDIATRLAAAAKSASLIDTLMGVSDAEASIRSTACAGFWFVISLGYGDTHAYTSCYK
jgi:hypothetical protein